MISLHTTRQPFFFAAAWTELTSLFRNIRAIELNRQTVLLYILFPAFLPDRRLSGGQTMSSIQPLPSKGNVEYLINLHSDRVFVGLHPQSIY